MGIKEAVSPTERLPGSPDEVMFPSQKQFWTSTMRSAVFDVPAAAAVGNCSAWIAIVMKTKVLVVVEEVFIVLVRLISGIICNFMLVSIYVNF